MYGQGGAGASRGASTDLSLEAEGRARSTAPRRPRAAALGTSASVCLVLVFSLRGLQLHAGGSVDHTCLMATAGLLVAYFFSALAGPNPSNLLDLECKLKHAAYLYSNLLI